MIRLTPLLLLLGAHVASGATVTAYCPCVPCCGVKAKPADTGITSAGTRAKQGRTIAAPRSIPLGTKVKVEGLDGVYTVEDRTARRFDGRWDLYFDNHKAALRWGKQELKVTIIK